MGFKLRSPFRSPIVPGRPAPQYPDRPRNAILERLISAPQRPNIALRSLPPNAFFDVAGEGYQLIGPGDDSRHVTVVRLRDEKRFQADSYSVVTRLEGGSDAQG
ncbi:MAG: hypothetical protein HY672_03140 [Chloroflexi bacterium]|nr:hypothetical protein [Chloroflexota bacterium]